MLQDFVRKQQIEIDQFRNYWQSNQPEKGTSLNKVGPKPLIIVEIPSLFMDNLKALDISLYESRSDCIFVLINSSGLIIVTAPTNGLDKKIILIHMI